jgi:hypothetical protein
MSTERGPAIPTNNKHTTNGMLGTGASIIRLIEQTINRLNT